MTETVGGFCRDLLEEHERGVRLDPETIAARFVEHFNVSPRPDLDELTALVRRLRTTLRALRAARALEGARIGIVGGLAMTFYNMEVSTNALRQRIGGEIAHHDIGEMTRRMAEQDQSRASAEVTAMCAAAPVHGVTDEQMELTGRAARASSRASPARSGSFGSPESSSLSRFL